MRNEGVGDLEGVDMQDTVHEDISCYSCCKHITPFRNLRYNSHGFQWVARIELSNYFVGFEQTIAISPQ